MQTEERMQLEPKVKDIIVEQLGVDPERVKMEEGCLSIPGKFTWIERPSKVRVKFQTVEGEYKYWCLHKMDARVFLHEYDHLEGILMTDRV